MVEKETATLCQWIKWHTGTGIIDQPELDLLRH
jgi:hypothetical protein